VKKIKHSNEMPRSLLQTILSLSSPLESPVRWNSSQEWHVAEAERPKK